MPTVFSLFPLKHSYADWNIETVRCKAKKGSMIQNTIVSIIIPTLNEVQNIDILIPRVLDIMAASGLIAEVLVADGGSTDGTLAVVRELEKSHPVRLVISHAQRDLAGDVLHAAKNAAGDIVVVMDADLSHPPETIPLLLRPIHEGTHDLVIGSRYIRGGEIRGWPWTRGLISRVAKAMTWPLVAVSDPTSGFFAIRREQMLELGQKAIGFKITLELLVRGDDTLRVKEVPIIFREREKGESKLGIRQTLDYLKQIILLAGGDLSPAQTGRIGFGAVLLLLMDTAFFNLLFSLGVPLGRAHVLSFTAAAALHYLYISRTGFSENERKGRPHFFRCTVIFLLALLLRLAMVSALAGPAQWPPRLAVLLGIAASAVVHLTGTFFFGFARPADRTRPMLRGRLSAFFFVLYAVWLRLAFSGITDLIPEEAYYWMYAQEPALGYLDHPPMVSWLIGLSTAIFGNNEFAVRLPAFFCWAVAAYFIFRLASNLFDKTTAMVTIALMALLPIYFTIGIIMTPDAPFYAAWAGCLFFLERVLLGERNRAWWGVGLCLGLGLLSKYTIALLGPAILVFIITDRPSRHWLIRPEPYLAALVAVLLFSPVMVWNFNHDWASFAFQGPGRWTGSPEFSLHILMIDVLVLLTPIGAAGMAAVLIPGQLSGNDESGFPPVPGRIRYFALIFALIPLSVFIFYSLQGRPKLNWTGPVWLAALPLLARFTIPAVGRTISPALTWIRYSFRPPLFVALLLLYGGGMYYIHLGLPGLPFLDDMPLPAAWAEMSQAVDRIETQTEKTTGQPLIIVGMDKYFISSEYAFYDQDHNGFRDVSGRHLFGRGSLMWSTWSPASRIMGQNILMISFEKDDLQIPGIGKHFARISGIHKQAIQKNGCTFGYIYYRIGQQYQNASLRGFISFKP